MGLSPFFGRQVEIDGWRRFMSEVVDRWGFPPAPRGVVIATLPAGGNRGYFVFFNSIRDENIQTMKTLQRLLQRSPS
jgi:hypothetical protein